MSVVTDAHRACFNCKQHDNEELADYTRSFKIARDILHLHAGGLVLVSKALQEIYPIGAQAEENDEKGSHMLFDVDRST